MLFIIDELTRAFLAALQGGGEMLAVFMLPILSVCALIAWYREYSATVMSSGAGMGDALAHALLLVFGAGCYLFFLTQLFTIANAALDTVFYWGLLGAGSGVTSAQLRAPSFILETGLKVAKPLADFDTFFRGAKSMVKLAMHPQDWVAVMCILLAFIGITAHHILMLVEYYLAVMLASVLIPWGIWRITAGFAEFSLGWLTGALIRALVSSAVIGIATPTFDLLNRPVPGAGYFSFSQTFILLGGSFIYLVLAWVIPAQAARFAGHASLGLTGQTLFSAAMTTARFGLMVSSVANAGTRVISPMLQRAAR